MDQNRHADVDRVVGWLSRLPWVYFTVILVLLAAESRYASLHALRRFNLPIVLLPWAAGVLLLPCWRGGPLKNWIIPWLISCSFPAIVLNYCILLRDIWSSFGGASSPSVFALFLAFPIAWYLWYVVHMSPRRCPNCKHVSLIPLMQLGMKEKRSVNTWWCAGCGDKYWKDPERVWRKEGRMTWHDRQTGRGKPSRAVEHRVGAPTRVPDPKGSLTTAPRDAAAQAHAEAPRGQ